MKLVKEGDTVGEHDIYLGPATCNGVPIGKWYQSRTAEQAAVDKEVADKMRYEWNKMIASSVGFRVPIFKDKK